MTVLYKETIYDTPVDPVSLTEKEHLDSCDINKMLKSAAKGLQIRGGGPQTYGHDDLTMDGLSYRIEKERLESELKDIADKAELTQTEYDALPQIVREKFKFKIQAKNDDKTTKTAPPPEPTIELDPQLNSEKS